MLLITSSVWPLPNLAVPLQTTKRDPACLSLPHFSRLHSPHHHHFGLGCSVSCQFRDPFTRSGSLGNLLDTSTQAPPREELGFWGGDSSITIISSQGDPRLWQVGESLTWPKASVLPSSGMVPEGSRALILMLPLMKPRFLLAVPCCPGAMESRDK